MKQSDGRYICPEGYEFKKISERIERRGIYDQLHEILENPHCGECPVKHKCTKAKGKRKLSVCRELEDYHEEVKENLNSAVGQELMNQRRIYNEGAFGIIKQDYGYEKIRRKGITNVKTELILVAIGFNLRRYHKKIMESKEKEVIN